MCGLAGVKLHVQKLAFEVCREITNELGHRGPDDEGIKEISSGLFFGHRRLAILDLSPAGQQPMFDSINKSAIVFNGEIYNYKSLSQFISRKRMFRGHSDTETLLYLLSDKTRKSLDLIAGMFTFAFFNSESKQLIFARDLTGIKNLYYVNDSGVFLFASEWTPLLNALKKLKFECQISKSGLHSFLTFGCLGEKNTLTKSLVQLPSGTSVSYTLDDSKFEIIAENKFWNYNPLSNQNFDSSKLNLQKLFPNIVNEHLISDVSIGLFLSSGIDSTILAGLASEVHSGLESFTVCFGDHKDFDEDALASDTARLFKLKHTKIFVRDEDALEGFLSWLKCIDLPSIDGLNSYLISREVRKQGIKVALSGLGADELFGGYPSFSEIPRASYYLSKLNFLPKFLSKSLASVFGIFKGDVFKEKLYEALVSGGEIRELYRIRRSLFGRGSIKKFLGDFTQDEFSDFPSPCEDPIREVQRLEFSVYMKNMLLRDTDICSMAHGLEVRVPFLDRRLVDFALALDGSIIAPKGKPGKHLLREAMAKYLRPAILNQPKRGFVLPVGRWLKGPLKTFAEQKLKALQCLPQAEVQKVWKNFLVNPDGSLQSRIVGLIALSQVEENINSAV